MDSGGSGEVGLQRIGGCDVCVVGGSECCCVDGCDEFGLGGIGGGWNDVGGGTDGCWMLDNVVWIISLIAN